VECENRSRITVLVSRRSRSLLMGIKVFDTRCLSRRFDPVGRIGEMAENIVYPLCYDEFVLRRLEIEVPRWCA
jgi:hypothetical protein